MGISNTIQQLSVFLENREGRLDTVLKILAENDVNIVALSLADTSDYGMLRMIVSDPHKGKAALKDAGIIAMLTDVVALRVPHATGSLSKAMHQIVEGEINVEYMYAFANGADAAAVLKSDDPARVIDILKEADLTYTQPMRHTRQIADLSLRQGAHCPVDNGFAPTETECRLAEVCSRSMSCNCMTRTSQQECRGILEV